MLAANHPQSAPARRDTFDDGASNPITHSELAALFAVIGTPAWADVECVHSQPWRHYLQRLPGRAPTIQRRFSYAGDAGWRQFRGVKSRVQGPVHSQPRRGCPQRLAAQAPAIQRRFSYVGGRQLSRIVGAACRVWVLPVAPARSSHRQ